MYKSGKSFNATKTAPPFMNYEFYKGILPTIAIAERAITQAICRKETRKGYPSCSHCGGNNNSIHNVANTKILDKFVMNH